MHDEAHAWVARHAHPGPGAVLDIGGRDINGTTRALFPAADPYVVLDAIAGPGVDVVADAATWIPDRQYDQVVCTEVLEHAPDWRAILSTAYRALRPGGRLILTAAGQGRPPHSGIDGGRLYAGEYYQNADPEQLLLTLIDCGFGDMDVDVRRDPADVRAVAFRPMV